MIEPRIWVCPPDFPKGTAPSTKHGCAQVKGLVDTGAEFTIIHKKHLKGFRRKGTSTDVGCAGKGSFAGQDYEVVVQAPGCRSVKLCAVAVGTQPVSGVDMLLGYDYLKATKATINCATGRLSCQS